MSKKKTTKKNAKKTTKKSATRIEKDSMGSMEVPIDMLYGATTQRAVRNFPVAHRGMGWEVIHAFVNLKSAAATANEKLGKLDAKRVRLIRKACKEINSALEDPAQRQGMMRHFPVDMYQTGSGTSTNMNVNEVISNLACQAAGKKIGAQDPVHPNDHVNMGQSSNDTMPSAMQIAAASHIKHALLPSLKKLERSLARKAKQFDSIVKIGRTHLQDATPIRLGQEFSGYEAQLTHSITRATLAMQDLAENMPIGGTAVGTGINTHPRFSKLVCSELSRTLGLKFTEAANHFEAQATRACVVGAHGRLNTIAVSLSTIASNIRIMGCGPRCGIGELELPAIQPGSSIMPGKINPVIVESVMQVSMRVAGNHVTVSIGGMGGTGSLMELNLAMPLMAVLLLESITLLSNVADVFKSKCVDGIKPNRKAIKESVERSLMLGTALAPIIGYNEAAHIAHECYDQGLTIREYCLQNNILPADELDKALDVTSMTYPHQ
ncbi:MAG: class II fumarate hydratase [Planctomycetota bacterium]|nr:class II fumarate hydratase [Planctomycetota bacterium]